MSLPASRLDEYFQSWDDEALNQLTCKGPLIGKYSYFTVAHDYRGWHHRGGVSLTDLQVGIFCYQLLNSNCSAMTGTTRNNRKINQVCERGGAHPIQRGLSQHGCEIDLMAWYRTTAKPYSQIQDIAKYLWTNRIDYKNLGGNYVSRKRTQLTI